MKESRRSQEAGIRRLYPWRGPATQRLNEEEQRHIAEDLSEEELAVSDILTRPRVKMSKKEEREVKRVARELLSRLI